MKTFIFTENIPARTNVKVKLTAAQRTKKSNVKVKLTAAQRTKKSTCWWHSAWGLNLWLPALKFFQNCVARDYLEKPEGRYKTQLPIPQHFWLHHTVHCVEKTVSARLRAGSASAERVGQGEVGGVTRMLAASLGFEMAMVGTGWGISHFDYMDRLRKNCLHLVGFWQGRLLALWAGVWQSIVLTIVCSLMSGHGQSLEFAY